jgi:hypothetical protein
MIYTQMFILLSQGRERDAWGGFDCFEPEFGVWFARMTPLVESGRREFHTIIRNQGNGLSSKSIKLIHISTFTRPILVAQVSLENFTRTTFGKSIL